MDNSFTMFSKEGDGKESSFWLQRSIQIGSGHSTERPEERGVVIQFPCACGSQYTLGHAMTSREHAYAVLDALACEVNRVWPDTRRN